MSNERKRYISLRCKGGNQFHPAGQVIKLTNKVINIGETQDCDIRYESGSFMPEYYATILLNDDGESWRIVKRSRHIDIQLAGKGTIGYAHLMTDGDIIQFEGIEMTLQFNIHYDDKFEQKEDKNKVWQRTALAIVSVFAGIGILYSVNQEDNIQEKDIESFEESIYWTKVDSVQPLLIANGNEELLHPTKILTDNAPTGTAFLTSDGKLVTARHCIEYWLGSNLDLTTKMSSLKDDDILYWAIEAETFNQTHHDQTDSIMQLRVFFSVYNFMSEQKCSLSSTDDCVHINKTRDGIYQLADFSENYFWRSIRPYFLNQEMALGDVLWIEWPEEKGKIELATHQEMEEVKRGRHLIVCGYPMTGLSEKQITFAHGTIIRNKSVDTEDLFFESNINHGFSGGPILCKINNKIMAVGIVSRVDSVSSGLYKWAVPATMINDKKGEETHE